MSEYSWYLKAAAEMLNTTPEKLPEDLVNDLVYIDELVRKYGGQLRSRQVVASVLVLGGYHE